VLRGYGGADVEVLQSVCDELPKEVPSV
jgi:hypothetical protein